MSEDDVAALERQGWEALAAGGTTARGFYDAVLDETAVMLLPGGMVLTGRDQVLDAMGGRPGGRSPSTTSAPSGRRRTPRWCTTASGPSATGRRSTRL